MAEKEFREEQWEHRYDEHIAPINRLVDELRKDPHLESPWAPYVAPMYGGIKARLLSVLRDPGPKGSGSGFLCMENDDPTAETISKFFAAAQITADDIVPWNVYPWYINRDPSATELKAGVKPLKRLIDLLPNLKVVMLHGGSAKNGWKLFTRSYPNLVAELGMQVIPTYHTSQQAFWHPDTAERERRKEHLRDSFQEAARILRNS
ncbi:hypothetical protein IAD21_02867 [Abditibacteriota bacterium]|nr:hypothetical protein IAD21_02867 [Abditibacteriota bacterium]